jgi:outer membrane immunogenic protein
MAMKRLLLGGVALAALSTAAVAVEIGPAFEALPPAEAAPYNWTGMYGRMNTLTPYDSLMFGAPTGGTPDSFVGSAQFGYNYQMGPIVLGIEGDTARRHSADVSAFGANALDALNLRNEQGWIGTLRPRAGLAADNWLLYGTGGLAYGAITPDGRSPTPGSARTGWTVGGGLEFESGKQWSLGLEYLYADFGKSAQSQSSLFLGGASTPGPIEDRSQVVRGRLNYRFGWDGSGK